MGEVAWEVAVVWWSLFGFCGWVVTEGGRSFWSGGGVGSIPWSVFFGRVVSVAEVGAPPVAWGGAMGRGLVS